MSKKITIKALKEICKSKGIKGYNKITKKNKEEFIKKCIPKTPKVPKYEFRDSSCSFNIVEGNIIFNIDRHNNINSLFNLEDKLKADGVECGNNFCKILIPNKWNYKLKDFSKNKYALLNILKYLADKKLKTVYPYHIFKDIMNEYDNLINNRKEYKDKNLTKYGEYENPAYEKIHTIWWDTKNYNKVLKHIQIIQNNMGFYSVNDVFKLSKTPKSLPKSKSLTKVSIKKVSIKKVKSLDECLVENKRLKRKIKELQKPKSLKVSKKPIKEKKPKLLKVSKKPIKEIDMSIEEYRVHFESKKGRKPTIVEITDFLGKKRTAFLKKAIGDKATKRFNEQDKLARKEKRGN